MKTIKLLLLVFLISISAQAQELITGKATLTKIKNGVYDVKIDNTTKQLDIRPDFDTHIRGTLSVLFQDCEELRLSVFQISEITEGKLISLVKKYNDCNYTSFQLTEKEARMAEKFLGDEFRLFAKLGISFNQVLFVNSDNYENLTQGQIGFGIAATPGFLGSLQGNLFFTLEVEAAFSGNKDFKNSPLESSLKRNSYKGSFGTEFHFNKSGSFQPLLGIGIGLTRDHFKGDDIYKIKGSSGNAFIIPKAGVLFSIDAEKSLGLIVGYIPKYTSDLSFINEEGRVVPFSIDTYHLNAGVYLYF